MFTAEEYPARLAAIGLSKKQSMLLRAVLEEMLVPPHRRANRISEDIRLYHDDSVVIEELKQRVHYYEGKADGINAVDRFLRGEMNCRDEFEDPEES